jgi:arsenate reductase-like glutaredoxin family protein
VQSASREPIAGEAALDVLDGVSDLYVAKGKKTLHVDLTRARPADDELLALLLGRSGKLRAPAIRVGKRLLIGFNSDILAEQLGSAP